MVTRLSEISFLLELFFKQQHSEFSKSESSTEIFCSSRSKRLVLNRKHFKEACCSDINPND